MWLGKSVRIGNKRASSVLATLFEAIPISLSECRT
jgi:hypothetical protein